MCRPIRAYIDNQEHCKASTFQSIHSHDKKYQSISDILKLSESYRIIAGRQLGCYLVWWFSIFGRFCSFRYIPYDLLDENATPNINSSSFTQHLSSRSGWLRA